MAYGLTDDLTKPQTPEDDDLLTTLPKKPGQPLPLGQGAGPGLPLSPSAPLTSTVPMLGAGAGLTNAQTNTTDPLAFAPLGGPSMNVVPTEQGYDSGLDGITPPQIGGPVTPGGGTTIPRMTPPNTPITTPKPTTPAHAEQDIFRVLYGDQGEEKRRAYIEAGGDPNNSQSVWASYNPGPNTESLESRSKKGEEAKGRFNDWSRRMGYYGASTDADANTDAIINAGGEFEGEAPPGLTYGGTTGVTRDQFHDDALRRSGYDRDRNFLGDPSNTVNGKALAPDDLSGPFENAFSAPTGPARVSTGLGGPSGGVAGVGEESIDPLDSLIGKQFSPNNQIDRVKVAQDSLDSTIQNVLDPAYKARLRDLNRYNFGAGRGVSGIARTSMGDVASDYGRQINDLSRQHLNTATIGSIDDLYRNLDEMQQERGYQKDLSDTAFGQSVTQAQLEDLLTNSAFGRSERQSIAGERGNPSDIALLLSQIFGGQSSAAMQAAARLFGGLGQRSGGGGSGGSSGPDIGSFIEWLLNRGRGGGDSERTTGVEDIDYGGGIPS